jgi:hypothetical protein
MPATTVACRTALITHCGKLSIAVCLNAKHRRGCPPLPSPLTPHRHSMCCILSPASQGKPTLATRRSSSAGASGRPLEIPHGVRSVTSAAGGSRASPSIPDTSASDPVTTQLLLQGGGVEEAEQQLHPTASLQLQLEGHTEQQGAGDVGASADTQTAAAASLSGLQLSGLAGNGAPGLLGVGWVTKGQPVPSAVSTQAAAPAAAGLQTGPAVVVSIQVGGAIQGGGGGGGERGPLQHRGGLGILPRVLAEAIEPSARRAALLQAASSLALQHSEAHSPGRSVNQAVGGMPAPLAPPTLLFNNATSSHIGGPLQQQAASSDQQQGQTGGHSISTSTIEISELRSSREAVQCLEAGLAQTSTETPGSSTATGTPNNSSTSTASCSTLGSGQTSAPSLLQGCGLTKSSAPVMLQPGAQGQPSSSVASGSRSLDTMPLKATDAAQGGPTLSPGAFSHHLNLASPKQHKQLPLPQHHHRQSQPAVAFSSTEGVGSSVRFGRRAPPRHSSSAASLSVVGSLPNGSACSTAAPTGSNYGAAPTITTVSPAGAGIPANARAQGVNGAGPVGLGGSSTSPAVRPLPTAPAGTSAVAPGLSGQGMYGMLVGAVRETNTGPSSTPLLSKGPPGQHQPAAASGISSGPPGSAGPSGALLLGGLGGKGSGAVRRRSVGDYVDLPAAAAQLQQRLHELGGAPGSSQQYNPTPAHQQQYTHSPPLPRRRAAQQGGGGAVLGHATYAHPLLLSLASSSSYRPPMLGLMFAPAAGMPGQS